MKNLSTFILSSLIFCLLLTCSENGTKPPDNGPDTTSHDFIFRLDTLGTHSSILNDVAVIDDNNIWAVGEIYVTDSTGMDTRYNAAVWNGTEWQLERIEFKTFYDSFVVGAIRTIFAFSEDDIWMFSDFGSVAHWNGSSWETYFVWEAQGSIYKMWGTSGSDLYAVGSNGSISHYNGNRWRKLDSGTDIDLLDVWGSPDGSVVWACGNGNGKGIIIQEIKDNIVSTVYENSDFNWITGEDTLRTLLTTLWTDNPDQFIVAMGAGIYSVQDNVNNAISLWQGPWNYGHYLQGTPFRIRGQANNDIFLCGDGGFLTHYNGDNWKIYDIVETNYQWRSLDYKDNKIVSVGLNVESGVAMIATGKRIGK